MKHVYLSGPITGVSYAGAVDWREYVKARLLPGIVGLSPMRGKAYLAKENRIKVSYDDGKTPLSSTNAIGLRDMYDATHADACLVYLPLDLKANGYLSYGTLIEMGWASAAHVPVILVTDDPDTEHPIIRKTTSLVLPTLDEALVVLNGMFYEYDDRRELTNLSIGHVPLVGDTIVEREYNPMTNEWEVKRS